MLSVRPGLRLEHSDRCRHDLSVRLDPMGLSIRAMKIML